jgi:diguanylate cyclase (GGDEF)-like protein
LNNLNARVRIILLVLAAMLPSLALMLYNGLRERAAVEETGREELRLIAELTAKRPEQLLLHARQLLSAVAANTDELLRNRNACRAYFDRMALGDEGVFRSIGVILPDGTLHCNSALPDTMAGVDVGDRTYFRQALESGRFVVGDFQVGRVSGRSGINFGLPVFDAERRVRAVLFAGLNLEKFIEYGESQHARRERIAEGLVTAIYDRNGVLLARYPGGEGSVIGQKVSDPLVQEILNQRHSGVISAAGRLYAVEYVGLNPDGVPPIRVVVSKPLDLIRAAGDHVLQRTVAGMIIITLLVLLAAWYVAEVFVLRRVRLLLDVAARIRAGDFSARTGFGRERNGEEREELTRLGAALDAMASELQARDRQLQQVIQQLSEQAITDQLTGLPNRRYLWDRLDAELIRMRRKGAPLSVILFDVDFFKQFNDRWGHEAGDLVLKNIASVTRRIVRGSDIVARYGGEEFVVVLPEAGEDIARARAEELRSGISALQLSFGGESLGMITVSVGVACSRDGSESAEQLVRTADHAMYEAKQGGRNQVVLKPPEPLAAA